MCAPPIWAEPAGHALMRHFRSGRSGTGCHHFDYAFRSHGLRLADRQFRRRSSSPTSISEAGFVGPVGQATRLRNVLR